MRRESERSKGNERWQRCQFSIYSRDISQRYDPVHWDQLHWRTRMEDSPWDERDELSAIVRGADWAQRTTPILSRIPSSVAANRARTTSPYCEEHWWIRLTNKDQTCFPSGGPLFSGLSCLTIQSFDENIGSDDGAWELPTVKKWKLELTIWHVREGWSEGRRRSAMTTPIQTPLKSGSPVRALHIPPFLLSTCNHPFSARTRGTCLLIVLQHNQCNKEFSLPRII